MPKWLETLLALLLTPVQVLFQRSPMAVVIEGLKEELERQRKKNIDCEARGDQQEKRIRYVENGYRQICLLLAATENSRLHGMLVVNQNGMIIEANPALAAMHRSQVADLVNRPVIHLIPYSQRPRFNRYFPEVLTGLTKLPEGPIDAALMTVDGDEVPVIVTLTLIGTGEDFSIGANVRWR